MTEPEKLLVEALRSGRFRQGRGALRPTEETYCCLGVACEVFKEATGRGSWDSDTYPSARWSLFRVDDCASKMSLPLPVLIWLGWATPQGARQGSEQSLANCNDLGHSFRDIASYIETGTVRRA